MIIVDMAFSSSRLDVLAALEKAFSCNDKQTIKLYFNFNRSVTLTHSCLVNPII